MSYICRKPYLTVTVAARAVPKALVRAAGPGAPDTGLPGAGEGGAGRLAAATSTVAPHAGLGRWKGLLLLAWSGPGGALLGE